MRQAFLGWGQGLSYGAPFAAACYRCSRRSRCSISARRAERPRGDHARGASPPARATATWSRSTTRSPPGRKAIYIRPMAEMNNSGTLYSGYKANGQPKGRSLLAGDLPEGVRADLRDPARRHRGRGEREAARLGLPPLRGGELLPNPFPTLRVLWSPLASDAPRVRGNAAELYYPGAAYVDVEGGDIYDERLTDTAPVGRASRRSTRTRSRARSRSRCRSGD